MKHGGDLPATKKDLEPLATKAQFEAFAKKMDQRMDTLESLIRNVRIENGKTRDELGAKIDNLSTTMLAAMKAMESRMITMVDGFMSKSLKINRNNVFLVHRMDKVEKRVSALERRGA